MDEVKDTRRVTPRGRGRDVAENKESHAWKRMDEKGWRWRRRSAEEARRRLGVRGFCGCPPPLPVTRSRGIVNRGTCTARLLVTVTVHLHSDLLNNAGIILRGKKKEVRAYLGRPRPRGASVDVFTRLLVRARVCLPLRVLGSNCMSNVIYIYIYKREKNFSRS